MRCFAALFGISFLLAVDVFAQYPLDGLTENFAFEVKSIDDFIDRFNLRTDTEFMEYLSSHYPEEALDRRRVILSLFNNRNRNFAGNPEIKRFIDEVTDSIKPYRIHFTDYEWYAMLECSVSYQKKTESLHLILKFERSQKKSTKWSIVSASAVFLAGAQNRAEVLEELENAYVLSRKDSSRSRFLHPVSHAFDFMNVDQAFADPKRFRDYFFRGQYSPELLQLAELVEKGKIHFVQVNDISYHFLQIPGWIFIVDYFNRDDRNSGWLINSLMKANSSLKLKYIKSQLNISID